MSAPKYQVFADAKALDKAIDATIRKSASLQNDIQIVAVGILLHAHKHGDYSRAQVLVDGLGAGIRAKALVDWFQRYGGLLVGENDIGKGFIGWQGAEYIRDNIDEAKAKMWYDCKPEEPFAGFNLATELEKLIKRAETSMKEANKLRHAGNDDDADKVKVSLETLEALRTLKAVNAA